MSSKGAHRKKVGLLGGSFNPPHIGHVGMVRYLLKENKVDQIWVIPCFEHPFNKDLVSFDHRFKMCALAFEEFGNKAMIKDVEKKLGGKSFTLRTVEHLQKAFPDIDFVLIVGEDAAKESAVWKDAETLKKKITWLVIPRGPNSPIPDVSATEIRKCLGQGADTGDAIPPKVLHYIRERGLFGFPLSRE